MVNTFRPFVFLFSWIMVFNATFNNIPLISWWSVLLLDETGVPGETHWQTLSHNVYLHSGLSDHSILSKLDSDN